MGSTPKDLLQLLMTGRSNDCSDKPYGRLMYPGDATGASYVANAQAVIYRQCDSGKDDHLIGEGSERPTCDCMQHGNGCPAYGSPKPTTPKPTPSLQSDVP